MDDGGDDDDDGNDDGAVVVVIVVDVVPGLLLFFLPLLEDMNGAMNVSLRVDLVTFGGEKAALARA